jgi:hypothetical protein
MAFIDINSHENDSFEVIRIVKYDANFNRLGAASVYAGEAYTESASIHGRFAERGGELAYHTSRTRYVTPEDGLRHQSNLTVLLDSGSMAVKYVSEPFPANHVSHSFDQYVLYDGGMPVYLDHGDGYPRAVVVNKARSGAYDEGYMLEYIGPSGANYTGVSVGGFQMSNTSYLTAVSTIDHSKIHSWFESPNGVLSSGSRPTNEGEVERRNIVVCALPRNFTNEGEAERFTLGSYWGTGRTASTPQLLPNGDGTFTVAWAVYSGGKQESFAAQTVDGRGRPVGELRSYAGSEEFYCEYFGIDTLPGEAPATRAAAAVAAEKAAAAVSAGTRPPPASDKPSSWAAEQVNAAIAAKLVPATLQSKYTTATTRAEFCALAVALYETVTGKEIIERATFADTEDVNVEKMAALGVVNGVGDNRFSPDIRLTREQAATLLSRLAEAVGKPLEKQAATFADKAAVSGWALESVGQIQAAGIMQGVGDNAFAPKDPYTREQSIITILRMFDIVK